MTAIKESQEDYQRDELVKCVDLTPFLAQVFRDMLREALTETKKVAETYPSDRFEVRTYEDFPNQIMYRIDNWVFNCVVAQPTQSRNHLTFKLDRQNKGVDNSFINHFQNVWGKTA